MTAKLCRIREVSSILDYWLRLECDWLVVPIVLKQLVEDFAERAFRLSLKSKGSSYKLVVLGDGRVGKSALTRRLISGKFTESDDPRFDREDAFRVDLRIRHETCTVDVFDTWNYEHAIDASMDEWMRESNGFVFVYSLVNRSTFEGLNDYFTRIARIKEDELREIGVVLAANKCDLEYRREVSTAEGISLAKAWCRKGVRTSFFETSAKTAVNSKAIFKEAIVLSYGTTHSVADDSQNDSDSQCRCVIV